MGSCWGAQNPGTLRVGLGRCTSRGWAWTRVHAQVHLGPGVFWVCLNSLRTCGTAQGWGAFWKPRVGVPQRRCGPGSRRERRGPWDLQTSGKCPPAGDS